MTSASPSHTYNLRPRKRTPRKNPIPLPKRGDRVSVFWESVDKAYEGTITAFDCRHKTLLVEYDTAPYGYEDNLIWENLDYVPWRFVRKRCEVLESLRDTLVESILMRNANNGNGGIRGVAREEHREHRSSNTWFQPGELSAEYPQFCTLRNGSWRCKQRRKSSKKEETVYDDDESGLSGEDMDTDHDSDLEGDADANDDADDEEGDGSGGVAEVASFDLDERIGGNARSTSNERHITAKRKYANFGALGFKGSHHSVPGGFKTNAYLVSYPAYAHDTIRVNCSELGPNMAAQQRAGSNETNRSTALGLPLRDQKGPARHGENSVIPPTVEERIRYLTRNYGLPKKSIAAPRDE